MNLSPEILRFVVDSSDCFRVLLVREALNRSIPGYQLQSQVWREGWGWLNMWTREAA